MSNTDPTKNRVELWCLRRLKINDIFSITFHVILMKNEIYNRFKKKMCMTFVASAKIMKVRWKDFFGCLVIIISAWMSYKLGWLGNTISDLVLL